MKQIISLFFIVVLAGFNCLFSQNAENSQFAKPNLPQESIYVHYNSSLLFSGEYLYMKVYCLDAVNGRPSKLSEIAYLELVNEAGKAVFKHKVALKNSKGQSDYFVPSDLPSGNYKLVGYTQWMINFGVSSFFQADITVLNPYSNDQEALVKIEDSELSEEKMREDTESENLDRGFKKFELLLSDDKFGKREKAAVVLKNNIRELGFGNYSLSIRKIDEIPALKRLSTINFERLISSKQLPKPYAFPPESSGSILSGKVYAKNTGKPAADKNVAISIPGKDFYFQGRATNAQGMFSFSLDSHHQSDLATLQVVEKDKESYNLELTKNEPIDYSGLTFRSIKIDSSMAKEIVQRSVSNQIENGYYSVKPDTIISKEPFKPFYYYEDKVDYDLDDFTRFPTMKETLIEIVDFVWTRRNAAGETELNVVNYKHQDETEEPPLLFIDGMLVQDHETVLNYDPMKVKSISFLRNSYIFGTHTYQGVILIETKLGDYKHQLSEDYYKDLELFKPKEPKQYYHQVYDETDTAKRIPDYRSQLLWEPNIELQRIVLRFDFFTSNNTGVYEISLEGFTFDGEPVSLKERFIVE